MSTIDLTKVAGFKAVDAEGNDMGIVSLSEMTNMVKESIIQEAVAMQSVSTLAGTSTRAATDTYEDRLPTSDTFSYVRTLDSSGNPKRTSSNAFASVVGGLLKFNFPKNGTISDLSEVKSGIYHVNGDAVGSPTTKYSTCVSFNNDFYTLQICVPHDTSGVYIRGTADGKWVNLI